MGQYTDVIVGIAGGVAVQIEEAMWSRQVVCGEGSKEVRMKAGGDVGGLYF